VSLQLAPQHKVGLSLRSPLLLAGSTPELLSLYDRSLLGAAVAPEVGGRERRAVPFVELPGGVGFEETRGALSFSGLRRLLEAAGDLPVIGTVLGAQPSAAATAARRLERAGLQALLVDLAAPGPDRAAAVLAAVRAACELPLLAQVPFEEALDCALACRHEADSLVIAAPPRGLHSFPAPHRRDEREGGQGRPPSSADRPLTPVRLHGPLLLPLVLRLAEQVASAVDLPLIARADPLTPDDAAACLAAGASALLVDTLPFVDPAAVQAIAGALRTENHHQAMGKVAGTRTSAENADRHCMNDLTRFCP